MHDDVHPQPSAAPDAIPSDSRGDRAVGLMIGDVPDEASALPARELKALRAVLCALNDSLAPEAAAQVALAAMVEATHATVGAVWLLDAQGSPVRVAELGLTPEYHRAQRKFPEWNRVQRELVALPDVTLYSGEDSGVVPKEHSALNELLGVHAMAVLPLRVRHRSIGVAVLGHADQHWFARYSTDFLCAIAEVVAAGLGPLQRDRVLHLSSRAQAGPARPVLDLSTPEGRELDRRSQELLAQMLVNLDTGVALLGGADPHVLGHNPAFALLVTGSAAATLTGHRLSELGLGLRGEQLQALVRGAVAEDRAHRAVELEGLAATRGASRWSAMVAPVAGDGPGADPRVVVALTDLTERRELEEQLRHAHKMEAVGTLAGGIAHEFNNLLTAILGNVSLSLLDLPPAHPLVPGLRDSETAALRAAELTRQLLGFGRRAPVSLSVTDLRAVVLDAMARVEKSLDPRVRIERDLPAGAVPVLADPVQVGQVIANLCLNARDAMPVGGVLTVRLRELAAARTTTGRQGEFACLEVHDTGEGIEPEVMARIYEPFFTTKGPDRGTGLGLALVHAIVEQHGGWIECESAPGQGTGFRIYLARRRDAAAPHPNAAGHGETVLVVDDEASLRGLARSILERLGYQVVLACDGLEALQQVQRGARIDIVLLDQTMPRLSGPETLRRLREIAPGLPVVLTSGYDLGTGPDGPGGLEVEGFLPKPYSPEHLGAVVREALDSRG